MMNRDFYTVLFHSSPVPTVILSGTFPDIIVTEANPAYLQLAGLRRKDLIGTKFFIRTPHPSMKIDEKGVAKVKRSIETAFSKKSVVVTPVQKFLKPVPGSDIPEAVFLEATNTPVLNAEGEIDFILRTIQNVTNIVVGSAQERLKDRQLREKDRLLRDTQKLAGIGTWEMDKNGHFEWSDIQYEIMEVEPGTKISADYALSLIKSKSEAASYASAYRNVIEHGGNFTAVTTIITPRGNERLIKFTVQGELKDGEFYRVIGAAQDITETKELRPK